MPSCTKTPSTNDISKIKEIISNSGSSSIYVELVKVLSKMPDRMQENVGTEHFSQIFQDNPYNYTYYNFSFDVNVSTVGTDQFGDEGIVNYISGTVPGSSHTTSSVP